MTIFINPYVFGSAGGGGGGYELPVTTDLLLWVDAAQVTGLSNGDALASWEDLSPYGADANVSVPGTGNRPKWRNSSPYTLNGLPGVSFGEGGVAHNIGGTLGASIGTTASVFIVVGTSSTLGSTHILDIGVSGTPRIVLREALQDWFVRTSGGSVSLGPIDIDDGVGHMVELVATAGGTCQAWIDGASIDSGSVSAGSGWGALDWKLNYNGATSTMQMVVHEVIVYKQALSSTDREAVESYLSDKWGISI